MKIMLIDDDRGTLNIMKASLVRRNHEVMDFADPREAVTALDNNPDLVISDIRMPHMDGFEVAERVAGTLGTSPPKVLLVSGNSELAERIEIFTPSVVIGILPKPFEHNDLDRVVSLLEKTRSCCPGTIGPFCMYAPEHRTDSPTCDVHSTPDPSDYSRCNYYDNHCGKMLRIWISTQNCTGHLDIAGYGPGTEPLLTWTGI